MSTFTFLQEHGLRMMLSTDGERPWYIVRTNSGEVVTEAPTYALAVKRAKKAMRRRSV
jgi:hypothetical protein